MAPFAQKRLRLVLYRIGRANLSLVQDLGRLCIGAPFRLWSFGTEAKASILHLGTINFCSRVDSCLRRLEFLLRRFFELNCLMFQAFGTEARPSAQPLGTACPCLSSSFFGGARFGTNSLTSVVASVGNFFAFAACSAHGSSCCTSSPSHSSNLGRDMSDQLVGHTLSRTS